MRLTKLSYYPAGTKATYSTGSSAASRGHSTWLSRLSLWSRPPSSAPRFVWWKRKGRTKISCLVMIMLSAVTHGFPLLHCGNCRVHPFSKGPLSFRVERASTRGSTHCTVEMCAHSSAISAKMPDLGFLKLNLHRSSFRVYATCISCALNFPFVFFSCSLDFACFVYISPSVKFPN